MSTYSATVDWTLEGDFAAGRYSRGHSISFDGGITVAGSASPANVPPPYAVEAAVDPEELFVASLSTCHMLWFLDLARRAGVVIEGYRDAAEGVMAEIRMLIGDQELVSVITRGSAERLRLAAGDEVIAVIKSSAIMIGREPGAA